MATPVQHQRWSSRVSRVLGAKKNPKIFLVVGECGDGKSTLINALRDPLRSGEPKAGLCSRGVTKNIEAFVGLPIEGVQVDYLDTPGVGDMDVTPMKVLTLIEQELMSDQINGTDAIDGVIVTTPVPDGRVKLGAQVVQLLVEHGFLGEDKWENIILVVRNVTVPLQKSSNSLAQIASMRTGSRLVSLRSSLPWPRIEEAHS